MDCERPGGLELGDRARRRGLHGFTRRRSRPWLTILLGIPAAYLFARFQFKGKDFLRVATTLPFILPTVVVAAGFNALIGPRGWL